MSALLLFKIGNAIAKPLATALPHFCVIEAMPYGTVRKYTRMYPALEASKYSLVAKP